MAIGVGLMFASFAAVLIRMAQEAGMPSLAIVGQRLLIAWLLLSVVVLRRHRETIRNMKPSHMLLAAGAGFWLATHFSLMALALEYSSVLLAQTIVNTGPLWVALLEVFVLKQRLPRLVWVGLFIAMLGGTLIGFSGSVDAATGSQPLLGAALAFSSAAASAGYIIIGRRVRTGVPLLPYIWFVYGGGALAMMIAVTLTGTPLIGYEPRAYMWVLLLALGPQLIAHSSLNYALAFIPATLVSISGQVISVTAAIAAFILFAEVPQPLEAIGSGVILVGVVLAILAQGRRVTFFNRHRLEQKRQESTTPGVVAVDDTEDKPERLAG